MSKKIDDNSNSHNHSIPASWEELDNDSNIDSMRTSSQSTYTTQNVPTSAVFDEKTGFIPKVRILKREEQHNSISSISKNTPQSSTGTTVSIDEKQRRYDQARKKIFEQNES